MLVERKSPHEDSRNCMSMGWWTPPESRHGTVVMRRKTNGTEKPQLLCDQPKSEEQPLETKRKLSRGLPYLEQHPFRETHSHCWRSCKRLKLEEEDMVQTNVSPQPPMYQLMPLTGTDD